MIIKSLTYWQHHNKPHEWKVSNCLFHPVLNLIVGKNANGKTRLINLISNLAALLSGQRTQLFRSGNWEVIFQDSMDKEIRYSLFVEDDIVQHETFSRESEVLLERDASGKGQIWAQKLNQKMDFQIETAELAALKKYDAIQHPFLHDLYQWAKQVKIYRFATDFMPTTLSILIELKLGKDVPPTVAEQLDKAPAHAMVLFKEGMKKFGDAFWTQIQKDMEFLGYNLDCISVEPVDFITFIPPLPDVPHGIYIKEQDLKMKIPQIEISQGMFRALSLLIHLNYLQFSALPSGCILVDDIGEGLDFDRASKLVKLILQKFASNGQKKSQIIMTSNDRFVMNGIPLEHWLLIERLPGGVKMYSKETSPDIFKEFEFTGLNNFDFLASEYFKG